MNTMMLAAITRATAALHLLSEHGCTVLDIRIRDRQPVLSIAPPTGEFLRRAGAVMTRANLTRSPCTTYVATVDGAQIEWTVIDAARREPAGARA